MELRFVFDGALPNARFVEVETADGNSVSVGEWRKRDDGMTELVVRSVPTNEQHEEAVVAAARALCKTSGLILDGFDGLRGYVEDMRAEQRAEAIRMARATIDAYLAAADHHNDLRREVA